MLVEEGWLMSLGERAALAGIVADLRPSLAVEVGRGYGGSLKWIAAGSREVHTIDTSDADLPMPQNAELHVGDSRVVLPELLRRFEDEGRNVDFALVDGDHSAEGVRADVENLLASPAVGRTAIVLHDSLNEAVRRGIEGVDFDAIDKVRYVRLDFVAGFLLREGPRAGQLWGGLGLIVVDADGGFDPGAVPDRGMHDTPTMIRRGAGQLGGQSAGARIGAAVDRVASRLGRRRGLK
jgi:hypothetical protein